MTGWECPRCNRYYSEPVKECDHCKTDVIEVEEKLNIVNKIDKFVSGMEVNDVIPWAGLPKKVCTVKTNKGLKLYQIFYDSGRYDPNLAKQNMKEYLLSELKEFENEP